MISFRNITTVARYERKILFRSWFFRIFAILSLVILGFFNGVLIFQRNPFSWDMRSLPSGVIYNMMGMLNIAQSIIAIFLASDFMKRDKKLDTAEVLFIRPMSNTDYVLGKTWGIVSLFVSLNLVVMGLSAILILSSGEIPFSLGPFLYYFFLLSIPSLVFILGLSFFLMGILKNQAITFLVLLAYIAANLFYLADKAFFMFDYLAFKRPMIYSDIIGFSNMGALVYHRMVYLLLGIAFILASILMLKRIDQHKLASTIASAGTAATLIGALFCGYKYLAPLVSQKADREKMIGMSAELYSTQTASVSRYNIKVEHGKQLSFETEMSLKNNNDKELTELLFTLNPGLKVEKIESDGTQLNFTQEKHIVRVKLNSPMYKGDKKKVTMSYAGNIEQSVCYLDAEDEKYYGQSSFITIRADQQYAVQRPDYLLLTHEDLWYPVAGIGYDPKRPAVFRQQFSRYTLEVKTDKNLTAISQGECTSEGPGKFVFKPRDPLPQISLVIGPYETRTIEVSKIKMSLSVIKGHNYFDKYLKDCNDTLSGLITNFLDNFERPLSMYYPYPQFTMVEVPAQFKALQHSWTSTLDNSQPQMVFLPERGYSISQADFKSNLYFSKRDNDRNNSGKTDAEMQADIVSNFLSTILGEQNSETQFGQEQEGTKPNPYTIYPNYYYFLNFISSDKCPVINYAFESYLRKEEDDERAMFMSRATGIGDAEKANLMLDGKSLKTIIATSDDAVALNRVLKVKGAYLLSWIQKQIGDQDFDTFLLKFLYNNSYREISYDEFSSLMKERFNINLDDFLNDWYSGKELPAYKIQNFDLFQAINNNQVVYLAKAEVSNFGNVPGLVKFSFRSGGNSRGGFGGFMGGSSSSSETDERLFLIGPNETHEIQMVLSDQPRGITFNTLISKNLPTTTTFFRREAKEDKNVHAEGFDRVIDYKPVVNSNEIIVDNSDNGFTAFDPAANNPIKKLFKKEDTENEYVGMGFGQSPSTWKLTASSDFYGDFVHSAIFIKSGNGSKTATWQTHIKTPGYYDVYSYNVRERGRRGGGPGGGSPPQGGGGPGGGGPNDNEPQGSYFYTIYHDDGTEQVELKLKDVETGWNLLGSFYISSDSAKIVLSDKSDATRIVADAVKWVKQGGK